MSALGVQPKYPSVTFLNVGDSYSGTVAEPPTSKQATKYQSTELDTFKNGSPVMVTRIILNLDNGEGVKAVYAKRGLAFAITDALRAAGASDVEVGGHLTVTYTADDPDSANPRNPRKLYEASYKPPEGGSPDPSDPWEE